MTAATIVLTLTTSAAVIALTVLLVALVVWVRDEVTARREQRARARNRRPAAK